jgi:hypothetical protein
MIYWHDLYFHVKKAALMNFTVMFQVLELHNMECTELSKVDLLGLNLTDMSTILFMNHTFSLYFQDVF